MKKLLTILGFFISIGVLAQTYDFNNYQPIESKGTLPVDFTSNATAKYESKKPQINAASSKFEKKTIDQYYLESCFGLDATLKSGKVLFNDTIGSYVTAIMNKILENSDLETKKIRVYCIKSSEVNAYATGEGVIFVTMGLMAYVKSEAQLAFILSHEYMHYICKHSVNGYIETKKILKGKKYGDMSIEKRYLATRAFSRDQESEADLKGLELFLKSEYSLADIDSAFEMLQFSYLPFGLRKLDKSFIDNGFFKVPESYFLSKLAPKNSDNYENAMAGRKPAKKTKKVKKDTTDTDDDGVGDLESTHPSITKRIKDIHKHIGSDSTSRKQFIISENAFYLVRKIARYELVRLNLLNHNYERAFYNAYNLLSDDPDSKYLKKCVAKALYGIAKFGNTGNLNMIHIKKKYAQDEWQQVPYLVSKLKGEGVSAWALTYTWKLKKEYPDDVELRLIFTDLMNSMVEAHVKKKNDFIMRYEDTLNVGSRNRKLKPYIRLAFVNLFVTEPEFKQTYEYAFTWYSGLRELRPQTKESKRAAAFAAAESKARKKQDDDKIEETTREDIAIHWNEKLIKGNKNYMDSGKVLFLCPRYSYWLVNGSNGTYKYLESEEGRMQIQYSLNEVLPAVFPSSEIINTPTEAEVERLNEIGLLYDWASEKVENGKLNMVAVDYDRVQALATKYEAGNMVLLNATCIKEKKKLSTIITHLFVGAVVFPILPVVIYRIFTPDYKSSIYAITINFKQDKIITTSSRDVAAKSNKVFFNSQFYALLYRLKNQ